MFLIFSLFRCFRDMPSNWTVNVCITTISKVLMCSGTRLQYKLDALSLLVCMWAIHDSAPSISSNTIQPYFDLSPTFGHSKNVNYGQNGNRKIKMMKEHLFVQARVYLKVFCVDIIRSQYLIESKLGFNQ